MRVEDGRLLGQRGHDVRVLSADPWHVAWQSGDTVVDVATDVDADALAELVAAFPGSAAGDDAGVLRVTAAPASEPGKDAQ